MKKVIIIDYQLGNLFSVLQACETIGLNVTVSSAPEVIQDSDALILPGVGAFAEAMNCLNDLGLSELIKAHVAQGKPLMGICLGQQLLFVESEEFGSTPGLGLIKGIIRKFKPPNESQKLRVPHIGWNQVLKPSGKSWESTPLEDIEEGSFMYFVHSYCVIPTDNKVIGSMTEYDGIQFCSAIHDKNIFSTQFHPEKSGKLGLSIYRKWATLNNLL